jgi:hypothetical protein
MKTPFAPILGVLACVALPAVGAPTPEISYVGHEKATSSADGGLRPVVGVQNIQVYRANRTHSAHADGLGHTYVHAPMLAYWHGTYYLDFLSAPVNEHDAPCPTSLTTSKDGLNWSAPQLLFPAVALPEGGFTVTHQRMSFYVSPNDRLLATCFHGKAPSPNDGTGIGRVVREIRRDGTFGPIHIIRLNKQAGFTEKSLPYPLYSASTDPEFVKACEALLSNKLVTAQWWEEDRSEDGFYRVQGKAISVFHRADGKAMMVAKDAQHAVSSDEGQTWQRLGFMANLPVNSSKYWAQRTSDGKFALVFNPTSRLRHPLALLTSDGGQKFDGLLTVHNELPVQRFPGKYKNMGPQYVRGISEGNGAPADGALWLTYSVNKEDIWVSRVPVPVTASGETKVADDFSFSGVDTLPTRWNVYTPLWAPVRVQASGGPERGNVLSLRDEDPCDYASVTRVFAADRSAVIKFKFRAEQTDGRLEIDVLGAHGERPVQIALTETGKIEAKHEGIWMPGGAYEKGRWTELEIDINDGTNVDRFKLRVDGKEVLERTAYFSELVPAVERLTLRTGEYRRRGEGGHEIAGADEKAPAKVFLIDDVEIVSGKH